jgi:hypothetical protein
MSEELTKISLEEFISGKSRWPNNAYVKAEGFKELYVRRTRRLLNGVWVDGVLDIARIIASRPGSGKFTALAEELLGRGIPLYVECVQNERFVKKLEKLGFTRVNHEGAPSFYKLPAKCNGE